MSRDDLRRKLERERLLREAAAKKQAAENPTPKAEPTDALVSEETIANAKRAVAASAKMGQRLLEVAKDTTAAAGRKAAQAGEVARSRVATLSATARASLAEKRERSNQDAPVEPCAPSKIAAPIAHRASSRGPEKAASRRVLVDRKVLIVGAVVLGAIVLSAGGLFLLSRGPADQAVALPSDPGGNLVLSREVEAPEADLDVPSVDFDPPIVVKDLPREAEAIAPPEHQPAVVESAAVITAPVRVSTKELDNEAAASVETMVDTQAPTKSKQSAQPTRQAPKARPRPLPVPASSPEPDWRDKAQQEIDKAMEGL